jgi:hypothetical protein
MIYFRGDRFSRFSVFPSRFLLAQQAAGGNGDKASLSLRSGHSIAAVPQL